MHHTQDHSHSSYALTNQTRTDLEISFLPPMSMLVPVHIGKHTYLFHGWVSHVMIYVYLIYEIFCLCYKLHMPNQGACLFWIYVK